jgi:hypothetical protein
MNITITIKHGLTSQELCRKYKIDEYRANDWNKEINEMLEVLEEDENYSGDKF